MEKRDIKRIEGYIVTHHFRDVDRYVLEHGPGRTKVRVYALLRDNQRYATVTAFAGTSEWPLEVQAHIRNLMLKHCPPSVQASKYQREPLIEVSPIMARAYHVIPSLAEQLCQQLVEYLRTLPDWNE